MERLYIWLDGHQLANLSYAPGVEEESRYRGVSVLLLQRNITKGHCDVISYRIFDTYDTQVEAEDLKNHLDEQPAGTVIAVAACDEATGQDNAYWESVTTPGTHINVVKPVLMGMGVDLEGMLM